MSDGTPKHDTPIDSREIDLLIDGELTEERRKELLTHMDERQDGWRQCALAFLEQQCWRESCSSLGDEQEAKPAQSTASVVKVTDDAKPYKRSPGAVARAAGVLMAMAASFLIALGLGSMIWNADRAGHLGTPGGAQQAAVMPGMQDATPDDPNDGVLVHDSKVFLPGKYHTVTITDKRPDGRKRSIQLPAVAQNNIDDARLRETPSAIPAELVNAFHEAGHKVRQSRRLVPFRMKDGRRLVVPVDQLDVHYVGDRGYQ